jgi:hypothetical protein
MAITNEERYEIAIQDLQFHVRGHIYTDKDNSF